MCGVMAFTAVALSIGAVSWCEFIEFTLPGGSTPAFGAWRYQSFVLVGVNSDVYKVSTCEQMPDSWDMDTKWMSSRVFSVLAPLLGTLACIAMCKSASLAGGLFFLTAMFQGLTLLLLKSDLCSPETNPAFALYPGSISSVPDCKIGRSAVVSIVATSFFFVAGVLALGSGGMEKSTERDDMGVRAAEDKVGDVEDKGVAVEDKVDEPEETAMVNEA